MVWASGRDTVGAESRVCAPAPRGQGASLRGIPAFRPSKPIRKLQKEGPGQGLQSGVRFASGVPAQAGPTGVPLGSEGLGAKKRLEEAGGRCQDC